MAFARFLASPLGRALRMIAGAAIVTAAINLLAHEGSVPLSIALILLGTLLFILGATNVSVIAPLLGAPFNGERALESKR